MGSSLGLQGQEKDTLQLVAIWVLGKRMGMGTDSPQPVPLKLKRCGFLYLLNFLFLVYVHH